MVFCVSGYICISSYHHHGINRPIVIVFFSMMRVTLCNRIINIRICLNTLNIWNTCLLYFVDCLSKITFILPLSFPLYMARVLSVDPFPFWWLQNICAPFLTMNRTDNSLAVVYGLSNKKVFWLCFIMFLYQQEKTMGLLIICVECVKGTLVSYADTRTPLSSWPRDNKWGLNYFVSNELPNLSACLHLQSSVTLLSSGNWRKAMKEWKNHVPHILQ